MLRRILGTFLVLHGLAHAGPGMWLSEGGPLWLVTLLWLASVTGFLGAGFGLLGVAVFRQPARNLARLGALASIALLLGLGHPLSLPGLLADGAILLLVWRWNGWSLAAAAQTARAGLLGRLGAAGAIGLTAYVTVLILLRPWHSHWGTSPSDRAEALPGDELVPQAAYRIDHAIQIHAPAHEVWSWLAQLGQDRAGFYSYAWLENLIGAKVTNADRLVPAWQERQVGEKVRAVPPTWMGGRFGREIGWRITKLVPGRALVLEGWGAFVVDSLDPETTRLYVRTRGEGRPAFGGVLLAPFGLLVFEPAHFIMQRGMLRGIKARAERTDA